MISNKRPMAKAKGHFTIFVERNFGKFPRLMLYAVLEWVLIILLFVDGFATFLANEFANLFELATPCWVCTKIDHIFVNRTSDFYHNDSICEFHKKEVSCLAYCHNHKRLADIRKMCEACLLSFAVEKESDLDTYKSLVGLLHKDLECFVEDDQHQIQLCVPAARKWEDAGTKYIDRMIIRCSCCGTPLKLSQSPSSYHRGTSLAGTAQAPTPSPRAPLGRNEHESDFFKQKDATLPTLTEGDEDDTNRTSMFGKGNRLFGIPLTDSVQNSPRVAMRKSKKAPTEKSEFAFESGDGNILSDTEFDSILQRLKRQVRLEKKSLMALYMELDEERNASAVAADEAMAMITRLQAEKASVQMEALQYQRMMEEQVEYDQDVLEATYDLLAKTEDDMRVLEAEIEAYREKYGLLKEFVFKDRDEATAAESGNPPSANNAPNEENAADPAVAESSKPLKGEKTYLLGRLKKLDKRNNLSSKGFTLPDGVNEDETGNGNKAAALTRQISLLSHLSDRVKALESDTGFLEHAARTLEKNSEGTRLLTEIQQNLQKLRRLVSQHTLPAEEQIKAAAVEQSKAAAPEQTKQQCSTPVEEQTKRPTEEPLKEQKEHQHKTPLEEQTTKIAEEQTAKIAEEPHEEHKEQTEINKKKHRKEKKPSVFSKFLPYNPVGKL